MAALAISSMRVLASDEHFALSMATCGTIAAVAQFCGRSKEHGNVGLRCLLAACEHSAVGKHAAAEPQLTALLLGLILKPGQADGVMMSIALRLSARICIYGEFKHRLVDKAALEIIRQLSLTPVATSKTLAREGAALLAILLDDTKGTAERVLYGANRTELFTQSSHWDPEVLNLVLAELLLRVQKDAKEPKTLQSKYSALDRLTHIIKFLQFWAVYVKKAQDDVTLGTDGTPVTKEKLEAAINVSTTAVHIIGMLFNNPKIALILDKAEITTKIVNVGNRAWALSAPPLGVGIESVQYNCLRLVALILSRHKTKQYEFTKVKSHIPFQWNPSSGPKLSFCANHSGRWHRADGKGPRARPAQRGGCGCEVGEACAAFGGTAVAQP